jgi:hypothetical protein
MSIESSIQGLSILEAQISQLNDTIKNLNGARMRNEISIGSWAEKVAQACETAEKTVNRPKVSEVTNDKPVVKYGTIGFRGRTLIKERDI